MTSAAQGGIQEPLDSWNECYRVLQAAPRSQTAHCLFGSLEWEEARPCGRRRLAMCLGGGHSTTETVSLVGRLLWTIQGLAMAAAMSPNIRDLARPMFRSLPGMGCPLMKLEAAAEREQRFKLLWAA